MKVYIVVDKWNGIIFEVYAEEERARQVKNHLNTVSISPHFRVEEHEVL
jgi:hypothetical protein